MIESARDFVERTGKGDHGSHGLSLPDEIAEVESRDAAIRKECADRAIECEYGDTVQFLSTTGESIGHRKRKLRAAIEGGQNA